MAQEQNALPSGAHVSIGGVEFTLDKNAPIEIQRPAYRRSSRSLFAGRTDISGRPGMQNLNPDLMRWPITDFAGEGQVILDPSDDDSFKRFYRSEGLNFRTPGQATLNTSTLLQAPPDSTGGASTTREGAADFSDITGTSSTTGTDRQLQVIGDVVGTSTNHTPGAGQVSVGFYLYKEEPPVTTVQGSAFELHTGTGNVVGSDFKLRKRDTQVRYGPITGLTTGADYTITATLTDDDAFATASFRFSVRDITTDDTIGFTEFTTGDDGTPHITFVAVASHEYAVWITYDHGQGGSLGIGNPVLTLDKITYGLSPTPNSANITVYNQTGSAVVKTKTVEFSNTTSAQTGTLTFTAAAATGYRYRVEYVAGNQRVWVDKVIATLQSTTAGWTLDAMELGQGGKVWLFGAHAGGNIRAWTYDFPGEAFTQTGSDLNATSTSGETVVALAHSDLNEYALTSGGTIARMDATNDAVYATSFDNATGICVAQGRMFVVCQTSTAVTVYTLGLDTGTYAGESSALATATVASANTTADTTIRQRMTAAPTGARFFVNYAVDAVIYEADSSGASLVVREIARLAPGVKATSIAHVGGVTFVGAQAVTETGETPVSTLWMIDANGIPRTLGDFRRVGGSSAPIQFMQAYQRDLWLLQGQYMWRYSLSSGGLYLEYELNPSDVSKARGLAVLQGHQFAVYSVEDGASGAIWVTGSLGTYRQSSVTDGNTYTTSIYNFGLPGTPKMLTTVDVMTDNMPAGVSVEVKYQIDQSGTWVTAGTVTSGASNTLPVSVGGDGVIFDTLQLRAALATANGVNTPTLKAMVASALPEVSEHFFDLVVRTEDENPMEHIAGNMALGGEKALALWNMKNARAPVSFIDGYAVNDTRNNPEYVVVVEDLDQSADDVGEGRISVRLRVLG